MSTASEPCTDEQLYTRWRGGDARAFEELFDRHRGGVYAFVLHALGDRSQADDLFQEVFFKVVRARSSYRPERGRFKLWLYTVARHALVDHWRRAGARGVAVPFDEEAPADGAEAEPQGAHRSDPHRALERGEVRGRIVAALAELPVEQREVFLLRERAGLSFEEVATAVGCPVPTAKSRMRYALDGLRQRLAGARKGDGGG